MSKDPVCGEDDLNKIRSQACLDRRIGRYLDTLNALGRTARFISEDDPDAPHYSFYQKIGSVREACIRMEGGNIRFIELWRTDARNVTWFTIAYLATTSVDYDKKDLEASLGEPFSAFQERRPLKEYKWKGGPLARSLSSDMTLKEALMPNKGQFDILFRPGSQIVAVTEVVGDHYPDAELVHIEAMERIMEHIRKLAPRRP